VSTSSRKPPVRKAESDYHHGDLRRALLTAAMDMLEADGSEALSLREVARRAGVSHNAPYRHFADREALLAAMAAEGFDVLAEVMSRAATGGAPPEVGVAYVRFATDHPQLFNLMFGPSLSRRDHPDLGAAMDRAFAVFAARVPPSDREPAAPIAPHLIASWALVHGLAHLLLGDRLGEGLTGSTPDVAELTRAVLAANAQKQIG
jgi:AcrR family transcriptional regulator